MDERNQLKQRYQSFKPATECPAFGVFVDNGATESDDTFGFVIAGRVTQAFGEQPLWINSNATVATNTPGECVPAAGYVGYVAYTTGDGTPAVGESWGPVPNSYLVRKGFPGFKILKEGAGGIALASFDSPFPEYYCELAGALSDGGSATAKIYKYSGSAYADSSLTGTLYATKLPNDGFTTGTMVWATWATAARRLEFREAACSSTSSSGA